jgi:hypothetical protein
MPEVKLRKPFDRFPHPYIYAMLIDAIDIIGFLPVIGEIIDVAQTLIALAIFENPSIAIIGGAADLLLAGLPDVIPTFTLRVFLAERGII